MTISRSLALCALVAVAGIASAQKVTLRFKPTVGKSYVYATTTQSSGSGAMAAMMNIGQSATSTMKILSKAGDLTKVSVAISNVKITVPKDSPVKAQVATMEKSAASSLTMSISSLGVASNVTVKSGAAANTPMSGDLMTAAGPTTAMPKEAVGPGSTWKSMMDLSKIFGKNLPAAVKVTGGKVPLTLKLVRFVDRGGKRLAEVESVGKGDMSMGASGQGSMSMKLSIKTTSLIDVATGVTVEMTSTSSNTMNFNGQGMTQATKSTMKLK